MYSFNGVQPTEEIYNTCTLLFLHLFRQFILHFFWFANLEISVVKSQSNYNPQCVLQQTHLIL